MQDELRHLGQWLSGGSWGSKCLRAFSFLRQVLQRLYPRFYPANLVSSFQSSGAFFSFQDPDFKLDDLVLSFSEGFFLTPAACWWWPPCTEHVSVKVWSELQQHIDLAGISVPR